MIEVGKYSMITGNPILRFVVMNFKQDHSASEVQEDSR